MGATVNGLKIFAGQAGKPLAEKICSELNINIGQAEVERYSDNEVRVEIRENVRGSDVFIINPTNSGQGESNFFDLMVFADAARRSSAGRITLVPTYLGYNRQDRKDKPRVPITARLMADMLSTCGAHRVLLLDLHSEVTAGFFNIAVDHVFGSAVIVPYLKTIMKDSFVVASPDKGGFPRTDAYASLLGQDDFVIFTKKRMRPGVIDADNIKIVGDVCRRDVLIVDDMIDTGGTVITDALKAKREGANDIYVCATHGLFSANALQKLQESEIKKIVVTDSIPQNLDAIREICPKIIVLSLANFLAQVIMSIHNEESVSKHILKP